MATMASMPLAVDLGSSAGAYAGGLLDPGELARIAHDLRQMKRSRIEGPNVPRARAVLVPLCHDARGVPHALFTVEPDDFGAPHVSFPGAPISRTIRPRDAPAVSAAMRDACDALGLDDDAFGRLEILGMTSDCPDVPRQTAVTPVVGYLGELDVDALCAGNAEGNGGGKKSKRQPTGRVSHAPMRGWIISMDRCRAGCLPCTQARSQRPPGVYGSRVPFARDCWVILSVQSKIPFNRRLLLSKP